MLKQNYNKKRICLIFLIILIFANCGFADADKIVLPVKFIKQDEMGCSRASFTMVMHHYNPAITFEMVNKNITTRAADGGTPNTALVSLAEKWGFQTRIYPGTIEDIISNIENGRPLIVHQCFNTFDIWKRRINHDRVVIGFDRIRKKIIVHDPARGPNIVYSYNDFLNLWGENFITPNDGKVKNYTILIFPKVEDPS